MTCFYWYQKKSRRSGGDREFDWLKLCNVLLQTDSTFILDEPQDSSWSLTNARVSHQLRCSTDELLHWISRVIESCFCWQAAKTVADTRKIPTATSALQCLELLRAAMNFCSSRVWPLSFSNCSFHSFPQSWSSSCVGQFDNILTYAWLFPFFLLRLCWHSIMVE